MYSAKIIAGITLNHVIGEKNSLVYKCPEDMRFFKEMTTGQVVIMGRNTFNSLAKPLPNRVNIVLTTKFLGYKQENGVFFSNWEDVLDILDLVNSHQKKEIFIIGGEQVYDFYLNNVHKNLIVREMYLSHYPIVKNGPALSFFPTIDFRLWNPDQICTLSDGTKVIKYLKNPNFS